VWVTVWVKPDFTSFHEALSQKSIYIFREKSTELKPENEGFSVKPEIQK